MTMIQTEQLSRHYENTVAVGSLDLAIEPGELFGFLGPNGAGKTTTIKMLCGLLMPTAGTLRIDGHDYRSNPQHVRQVTGLVPDTPPLYDHLTARQYIAFVATLYGILPETGIDRAQRFLELFGLADRADELCRGYSHGMRKKVHLAAVLATEPKVLFLDEPTTGLDPQSARRLKDVLLECRDRGVTLFLSTHRLETAEELCDRVAIMVDGELQALGTLEQLRSTQSEASLEAIFIRMVEESGESADGSIPE